MGYYVLELEPELFGFRIVTQLHRIRETGIACVPVVEELYDWDWDAVVAFVKHPELPPTNNEAERALRHAVIARNIGFGTRT